MFAAVATASNGEQNKQQQPEGGSAITTNVVDATNNNGANANGKKHGNLRRKTVQCNPDPVFPDACEQIANGTYNGPAPTTNTIIDCSGQPGTVPLEVWANGSPGDQPGYIKIKHVCSEIYVVDDIWDYNSPGVYHKTLCVPKNVEYVFTKDPASGFLVDIKYNNGSIWKRVTSGSPFNTGVPTDLDACPYAGAQLEGTVCMINHTLPPIRSAIFTWGTPARHYYWPVAGGRDNNEKCPVAGSSFNGQHCWFPANLGIPDGVQLVQNDRWGYSKCPV